MEDTSLLNEQTVIIDLTDIIELGQHASAYQPDGLVPEDGVESQVHAGTAIADSVVDVAKKTPNDTMKQEHAPSVEQADADLVPASVSSGALPAASLEQRLAEAEKMIADLCAEVQRLRTRLDRPDFSSEVFLIHAAQATQGISCGNQYLLPEHASEIINDAVGRVEKLESRMKDLEDISERSAAKAAAHIIREEISALKQRS